MSLSIFEKKEEMPCDKRLKEVLGNNKLLWDSVLKYIEDTYEYISYEWKFYSKQAGWLFVLKSKKRTLLYLIPQKRYFKASFVYGKKAVTEAEKADISEDIINIIKKSKCYAEGYSFMIDVKTEKEVKLIEILVKIKFDN